MSISVPRSDLGFALTSKQLEQYKNDGFVVVDMQLEEGELIRLGAAVDQLVINHLGWEQGDFRDLVGDDSNQKEITQPQILMPQRYSDAFRRSPVRDIAWSIAKSILGHQALYEGEHVILKPAACNVKTPLHQDEAFWSGDIEYQSLTVWVPLVDATVERGCLQYVPGSHKGKVLDHHSYRHKQNNNSLEIDDPETFQPVPVPVPLGSAVIHHSRIIHGAGPNKTGRDRPAYIFGFGLPVKKKKEGEQYHWQVGRLASCEARSIQNGYRPTRMRPEVEGESTKVGGGQY